ncbi:PREDICTED: OTU domain-containing protein 3 isoform X1 [Rhinopithecus bieti]|uniref:OTU domain-containing protein 3 n=1 Tax=Rhinopithecus bieti TaxID=61621 RepID=A0A2K6LLN7_RHIBE|nr:PREDICTED: OTU domain-containing protein 3 isoform X1 [Rhinopithecus bieti]
MASARRAPRRRRGFHHVTRVPGAGAGAVGGSLSPGSVARAVLPSRRLRRPLGGPVALLPLGLQAKAMSRKQAAKSRPGSGSRKAEAERKRDERAARRALAKERRNRPESGGGCEEEFLSFANQLQALGLKLREVPGDGNCLFRALGDQLEGHSRNHLKHRQETVDYMIKQREDFEPFVEDDIPFEKHVASLAKPGTFAGNDAIVAFARNHQLNVVIHQLNAPLWQIRGTDKSSVRELHIAYRYGEHYDSVRRINDNSEAPAHLLTDFQMLHQDESNKREKIKTKGMDSEDDLRDEVEDAVQKVCNATGCSDFNLIVQNLEAENYNIESAIIAMLQMNQGKRNNAEENLEPTGRVLKQCGPLWEEGGSGARIFGNQGLNEGRTDNNKARASPSEENKANKNQLAKVTNKQRREQQWLEKKKRQEERHRHKALESRGSHRDNNRSEAEANTQVTLVKTFAALNI